jgi:membrane-bound metal-dependent hydrolase YbcI (DUF457 family)
VFTWLGSADYHFFEPLHTPIGACLIAGVIALFFQESKKVFIPLGIGILTHFTLDFFLHVYMHGGMKLLFPFSWEGWQLYLIRSDDYRMTVVAVLAALVIYAIYWYHAKRKKSLITKQ